MMRDMARQALSLDDFEVAAKRFLPRPLYGYVAGAAETNASLRDSIEDFQDYRFCPRALVDVSRRTTQTTLLGTTYSAPFGIAPMGISALLAYNGDIVLAQAAREAEIPMMLSGASLTKMEDVIEAAPDTWFQAHLTGDPARTDALIDRTARAGYRTLVVTVDIPVLANRENNVRNGFHTPLRPSLSLAWQGVSHPSWSISVFMRTLYERGMLHFENSYAERGAPIVSSKVERELGKRDHLDWTIIERIRARWQGKIIIKGVLHPEDALKCVKAGADAIIVSNHGGRQLDGALSPLRALQPIVQRVGGAVPVLMDGGVRRGTDVLKALALGASFVFVGRPFIYAAAVAGKAGALRAAEILTTEINRDMGLLGINTVDEMSDSLLSAVGLRSA